jgi:membrane dipeptidase
MPLSRRTFIAGTATTPLVVGLDNALAAERRDPLKNWIVINTLGGFEDPNQSGPANPGDAPPTITRRTVSDARASGVTALNQTLGYVLGKGDPYEQTLHSIAEWDQLIKQWPDDLMKVRTAADIRAAKSNGKVGVIYGFQNSAMMGSDAKRVDQFAALGVRIIQLTYNNENQLGGGSLAAANPGLTPFGREVVERLNAKRVIVDLAHSGQQTCLDAIRASKQPIAITHTGCRALLDHPRNKSDEELRQVASQGGFVGIYFMPFLTKGRTPTSDDIVAHLEHAVAVCGEDNVGVGTDGSFTTVDDLEGYRKGFAQEIAARRAAGISAPGEQEDIFPFAIDMRGPDQLRQLFDKLSSRGHSASRIEKIMGKNFFNYAAQVWGAWQAPGGLSGAGED